MSERTRRETGKASALQTPYWGDKDAEEGIRTNKYLVSGEFKKDGLCDANLDRAQDVL